MGNLPFTIVGRLAPGTALAALLLGLLLHSGTPGAQVLANWQFGTQHLRDSRQQIASLTASTLLSGGDAGDYAPVLTLSCVEGDNEHWQQQLELQEPLSSRGIITLWASFDGATPVAQTWVVTGGKRTATLVGTAEILRLMRAHKLTLQWNWGWSWLWLSDSVQFQLGDVQTVVFALAKSCSIAVPGRQDR